ncbi:MAG: ABC-F family ATP-binding cassette domain-containing protein [Microvirga sp.]|jgi:ATP-binding cassette subfamily F protein 3|uniref:ABC-F family ATP-binding cassette domain-containing protein n=2 Tax=Hyphomicrobiales TaxID=356 RepID=A0A5N7MJ59_9HYPH|nr:ABC-F family ATP-binding cassette domain-containing protein [Microvirga tunisiensis]MPR08881.1 ABC-F family ATP-binding cassette domain-containing protein [Microvirga tunisiensis]MPR27091.1 ABC-F family ATP-binding cassette domain-containing protein [Microvirga tunisiensis]
MLHVNDLTYRIGDRLILDHASFNLPTGAKVGLVGRNGAGKTTLFKIIQGELATESGGVALPRGMKIGAVAQEAPGGPESLIDVVLAADKERSALLAEAETADGIRRAEIETRLTDIGAHSAPARAATILHGLGFDAEAQNRPCSAFSGGWRMRVALAAVLFTEPDLLLLDEPTNYLDLEGTLWLYDYLGRYPHTVLVISHDRELLDACVNHILHLDRGKLTIYRGGYTSFAKQYAEKRELTAKMAAKQEAERKHLQAFVDRFKAKASKARQAQSRVKRLEKMEAITTIVEDDVLPFNLPGPERPAAPPLITVESGAVGYGERVVLDRLNLTIAPDDRIALLGSNGNGKSTFCKLIGGRLEPMKGEMRTPTRMDVAYFAQHQLDELNPKATAYDHVAERMPDTPIARIRARTAQIGFPGAKADTPVSALSGGEKARLLMGLAAFRGPHLLILDEPTNHLDIDSRTALMEAINDYTGAVILVSHDRFLIEACADRLWIVGNGSVKPFDGDMDDYRQLVLSGDLDPQKRSDRPQAPTASKIDERRAAAERRVALAPLRKKLEALESRMAKLTDVIGKVDAALADGTAFQKDPAKATELSKMRAEAAATLASAEEEWLMLSSEIEEAGA